MELGYILVALALGLAVGWIARFAVPGPDPMPIWLTIAIGLVGSALGTLAGAFLFGSAGALTLAVPGAIALVVVYRRFVQRRGVTGPEAKKAPTRGLGVVPPEDEPLRRVRELERLREAGVITPEEYARRRADLDAGV